MLRRILVTLALVASLSRAAEAAIAVAKSGANGSSTTGTSMSVSISGGVSGSTDAVIIFLRTTNSTCSSSTMSAAPSGLTFLTSVIGQTGTTYSCLLIYTANGGQSGVSSFAFTDSATAKYGAVALDITGQNTSQLLDTYTLQGYNTGTTAAVSPSTYASQSGELALSAFAQPGSTFASDTQGYSNVATASYSTNLLVVNSLSISAPNPTYDAGTFGTSAIYSAATITVLPSGVFPAVSAHRLLLLGAGR